MFSDKSNLLGYGSTINISSVNSAFLNYVRQLIPHCKDNFMVIKGTKDSNDIITPGRHIHTDDRLCAINVPLLNCKQGADTVFYNINTLKKINFVNPTNSTIFIKDSSLDEIGRFTLDMNSAYLLDTTVPHCKIQTYNEYRILLSISIDLPFEQAVKYFE
jgi:hypothetical protein